MSGRGPPLDLPPGLETALAASGPLGATARQLARRTRSDLASVADQLELLARRGEVHRMGRGLWVLGDFAELTEGGEFEGPRTFAERFVREDGVELGTYSGPITFRSNDTIPFHRWWPYVQGYSGAFVAGALDRYGKTRRLRVLDPFAGSGTTLVEARLRGHAAAGSELLAPAVLAARVKTNFELDPDRLEREGRLLVQRARRRPVGEVPFLRETHRQFTSGALGPLTRLRAALPPEGRPPADALRLAFGRILIPSSRLHRSPCLGYRRTPHPEEVSPYERFLAALDEMATDLRGNPVDPRRWGPASRVVRADARVADWPAERFDLAVTSPPYVNGMDYVMNYKVDLAWLGYASSYADLARLRAAEVACDNLPRSETAPYLGVSGSPDPWLEEILSRVRDNVARKGSYRRADMHAVVHRYFADLVPVLRRVRRALRPGGRFVLVVGDSLLAGVYVPGDLLLARIASRQGYRIDSVEVARPRRSGQRRSFLLRESVVTLTRRAGSGR